MIELSLKERLIIKSKDNTLAERLMEKNGNSKTDDIVEFSLFIENLAVKKRMTLMDTILEFCDEYFIEPIEVITHISSSLKEKMEIELIEEGKLPRFTTKSIF